MKLLSDWGFSWNGWKQGNRGEYWVLTQVILILALFFLPTYRPSSVAFPPPPLLYGIWAIAFLLALTAAIFFLKGLLDLGKNLTPLPSPRDDGQLVQSGIYAIVRHPIYAGVTLGILAWAVFHLSLTHLGAAIAFFLFFNAKADREEKWLTEKYPEYAEYQQRVKKLIPWIY